KPCNKAARRADKRYESSRLTMRITKYRPVCDCTLPRLEKWADRWMRDTHFRHAVRGLLYGDTWSKEQMEWLMSLWHKRHSVSVQENLLTSTIIKFCGPAVRVAGDSLSGFKCPIIFQKIRDAGRPE